MATLYDLNITKGSQFSIRFTAQNEDGTPINLSGHNLRGYARQNYGGPILVDLNPIKVAGYETSGYIDVNLTSIQTSGVPVTQGVYDVELYSSSTSYVEKLIKGYIEIHPEATY